MKRRKSSLLLKTAWKNIFWIGLMHLLAIAFAIQTFTWGAFICFFILYVTTAMIGICVGFHRFFAHKSFTCASWFEKFLAFCGTLACQGSPLYWVAAHRLHHAFSDTHNDPHNSNQGFFHSHFMWLMRQQRDLEDPNEYQHYIPDMRNKRFYKFLGENMVNIQILLAFLLYGIGSLFGHGWSFVVWGICVRLVAVYHVTWAINSLSHMWGNQPLMSHDNSRNNFILALLTFGEGWHNNHHAKPRSARMGLKWWQIDISWMFICLCRKLKIIKSVYMPGASH
jgi:fatty-acid desaturase